MSGVVRKYRAKRARPSVPVPPSVKRYVARALDASHEDKWKNTSLGTTFATVSNAAWTEAVLSNPAQGDTVSSRQGSAIRLKSVDIHGVIEGGSTASGAVMRIVLGLYQAEILTPMTTMPGSMSTPIEVTNAAQFMEAKYLDQYVILDGDVTDDGATTTYYGGWKPFKYTKRFPGSGLLIQFGDTGTAHANRNLILSMLSTSTGATHPGFECGYAIVHFEDA